MSSQLKVRGRQGREAGWGLSLLLPGRAILCASESNRSEFKSGLLASLGKFLKLLGKKINFFICKIVMMTAMNSQGRCED